jgi:thiol-disulfide isomerase/thioredoxin
VSGLVSAASLAAAPSAPVAWRPASTDAEIDRAFAQARGAKRPVLLYWGASWCPPCNQLKATLFNRQDFAAVARGYVTVHVDGDRPGAQRIARRFGVSGYPTMVVFSPAGAEVTRLPGEAEPQEVLAIMRLGLAGGRPVKALLGDARAGKPLTATEWRMLAHYSWATDDRRLVPKAELPIVLAQLAAASPVGEADVADRLWLKAITASDDGKGLKPDAALRQRVEQVLADAARTRSHSDLLSGAAADIVRVLSKQDSAERQTLLRSFDGALKRLEADATLSRADRLGALIARVELARLGAADDAAQVSVSAALQQEVREHAARADREITDGYERQAVITAAAWALGRAGLWSDSDALLTGNLARSHSPYYLMSQLGSNARKQGRNDEALTWFERAYNASVGPATRLQWGASYIAALVDLASADASRIEKVAAAVLNEAAGDSGAFAGRSLRSLQRVSDKLVPWGKAAPNAAALARLRARLEASCNKHRGSAAEREACRKLLRSA